MTLGCLAPGTETITDPGVIYWLSAEGVCMTCLCAKPIEFVLRPSGDLICGKCGGIVPPPPAPPEPKA